MNDELDVLARLVAYHDHIAVPAAPVADDVRRGQQRVRRTRGLVTGGVVLGVAALVVAAALAVTRGDTDTEPPPVAPSVTEDATDPVEANGPRNGAIVRAEDHYAPGPGTCAACSGAPILKAYDPVLDRTLWAFYDLADVADGTTQLGSLSVARAGHRVAALACPEDFACTGDALWTSGATLGPGVEEITIESADQEVQVIAYDGTVRRTLDLSAGIGRYEWIDAIAWSPDRSRLAVQTVVGVPGGARIWLFDRDGGSPVLVHTAVYPVDLLPENGEFRQVTYVSDLSWSPDGSRLGFMEEFTRIGGGCYCELEISSEAVALRVPDAGEGGPGVVTTLYRYDRPSASDRVDGNLTWSPDGTRAAVVAEDGILELSADDGSVLARHPSSLTRRDSDLVWLVWPAQHR